MKPKAQILLLFIWAAASVFPVSAQTQSGVPAPEHLFTNYPTHFFISTFKAGYETRLSEKLNIKLIGQLTSTDLSYYYDTDTILAFGVEIQPRRYISRLRQDDFSGLFAAPYLAFSAAKYVYEERVYYSNTLERESIYIPDKVAAVSAGYLMGLQYLFKFGLSLELYGGGGVNFSWGDHTRFDLPIHPFTRGIAPHGGFSIGFAF